MVSCADCIKARGHFKRLFQLKYTNEQMGKFAKFKRLKAHFLATI